MTENLQRALEEQKRQTSQEPYRITGLLGMPLGGQLTVEVPNRNAYVFVRLRSNQSEVIQAFNNQVASSYNLPVVVERHGNKYIVVGVDTARYENNWNSAAPFLPRHGNTHSFDLESGGGGDIVWVYPNQFMPALVLPSGSAGAPNVIVSSYVLKDDDGSWKYVGNTGTPSFSPYLPPSGTQAVMGLVYLNADDGNPYLLINSGTYFSNTLTGTSQIVPYIPQLTTPTRDIPLAAVRLITGTSQISWNNIYDVRQWIHVSPSGTSGGLSSVAVQDEGVAQGNVTTFNFVGDNVSATVAGSVARVYVTGSTGGASVNTGTLDARYLKLDASNDPVTGNLRVNSTIDIVPSRSTTDYPLEIVMNSPSAAPIYVSHAVSGSAVQDSSFLVSRSSTFGAIFPYPAVDISDGASNVLGEVFRAQKASTQRTHLHPYATGAIVNYLWDTDHVRPDGTVHSSWRMSGTQVAYVDVSGTFYSNSSPLVKEAPVITGSYVRNRAGWINQNPLFLPFGVYTATSPMSADSSPYGVSLSRTVTFVKWTQSCAVITTNDGSNYWKIRLQKLDGTVIKELNTSAMTAGVWDNLSTTSFDLASAGLADKNIQIVVVKQGNPGNLYMVGPELEISV